MDQWCAPGCQVQLTQYAGAIIKRFVDVSALSVAAWQAHVAVAAASLMRPTWCHQTGFVYVATAAGETASIEPVWPTTAGGTVTDGSVTWTAAVPPAAGQDTVASATWTQVNPPDSALTITSQSTGAFTASAMIGGGTSGQFYVIEVLVTMQSGAVYPVIINLTVL